MERMCREQKVVASLFCPTALANKIDPIINVYKCIYVMRMLGNTLMFIDVFDIQVMKNQLKINHKM